MHRRAYLVDSLQTAKPLAVKVFDVLEVGLVELRQLADPARATRHVGVK